MRAFSVKLWLRQLVSLHSLLPLDDLLPSFQSAGKLSSALLGLVSCSVSPTSHYWFVKRGNRVMMRPHEITAQPVVMERTSFPAFREAASFLILREAPSPTASRFPCKYTFISAASCFPVWMSEKWMISKLVVLSQDFKSKTESVLMTILCLHSKS